MKIGFLFAGQGSQSIGMGKDLYDKYEAVRNVYNRVQELTGIDIAKISFEGPEDVLNETRYTQLAVLTDCLAILEVLKERGISAEMSAGLSLGEYAALIYSGALSFDDGVKIVKKRGEVMQTLLPDGEWKMAAIMGLNEEQVEEVCKKVKSGFVVPANYNCIGQIVVSGEADAVLEVENLAKEAGAKKVRILNTAGPFHTEKLYDASVALRNELSNVQFNRFNTKVVKNLDGKFYSDSDDIRNVLANHIIRPVRFTNVIETMLNEGVDTFIEIGPGKTLSGFVKRMPCDKEIKIWKMEEIL